MTDPRLRKAIAVEAARLMYSGEVSEYFQAKRKAASRFGFNYRHQPHGLPSNREIRDEVLQLSRIHEGAARTERLGAMRHYALWLLRRLRRFHPRLIGSVATGHIRSGSDIDLHVFSDSIANIVAVLRDEGLAFEQEAKRVRKQGNERVFHHIHIQADFPIELTIYTRDKLHFDFKSSITHKSIEKLEQPELIELLQREHPEIDIDADPRSLPDPGLRRAMFSALVGALEGIRGGPHHPEGCQLFHSLQVFELARSEHPYDVELAEAGLLHDIGKAIDPADHPRAGEEAVAELVSGRVRFLIAHHIDALKLKQGSLKRGLAHKLRASPYFDDLMVFRSLDERGRRPDADVPSLEEALDHLETFDAWEQAARDG